MFERIAVLIPCLNEAHKILEVIKSFQEELPGSQIYVYDNGSTDNTVQLSLEAGAIVKHEKSLGKGNVVRRMFGDIEAEIYLLVDGDGTYQVQAAPKMVELMRKEALDMVVGARVPIGEVSTFRPGHKFGNKALTTIVGWLFGKKFTDILSGFRVFSRRFVKSFPALSRGFEIETEMTIHALDLSMPVSEFSTKYSARAKGSKSKLNTWRDGLRILFAIIFLFKEVQPFKFFGVIFLIFSIISILLGHPLFVTFVETGLVPRFPTAILATGIMILAFISLAIGIILDSICRSRREIKRMHYLANTTLSEEKE